MMICDGGTAQLNKFHCNENVWRRRRTFRFCFDAHETKEFQFYWSRQIRAHIAPENGLEWASDDKEKRTKKKTLNERRYATVIETFAETVSSALDVSTRAIPFADDCSLQANTQKCVFASVSVVSIAVSSVSPDQIRVHSLLETRLPKEKVNLQYFPPDFRLFWYFIRFDISSFLPLLVSNKYTANAPKSPVNRPHFVREKRRIDEYK